MEDDAHLHIEEDIITCIPYLLVVLSQDTLVHLSNRCGSDRCLIELTEQVGYLCLQFLLNEGLHTLPWVVRTIILDSIVAYSRGSIAIGKIQKFEMRNYWL